MGRESLKTCIIFLLASVANPDTGVRSCGRVGQENFLLPLLPLEEIRKLGVSHPALCKVEIVPTTTTTTTATTTKPFGSHAENTLATYQETQNKNTTENSHIGHCTHTSESTNVKVHNIQHRN
jgi:hypothetical protein